VALRLPVNSRGANDWRFILSQIPRGKEWGNTVEPTRITTDEARARMDKGEPMVFIDSRNRDAWAGSSLELPGALRIPSHEVEAHLKEILPNRTIITYCT